MRKIFFVFLLLVLGLSLVGCEKGINGRVLDKPEDTNLEFWVGENVDNFDFSNHHERFGMFGGHTYYGLGYAPEVDENDNQLDPEHYVIYTVTSFPDYSSKQQCVTSIKITDPKIVFLGLGINSTFDEFDDVLLDLGFEIEKESLYYRRYTYQKYTINKSNDGIYINLKVTNRWGIIF